MPHSPFAFLFFIVPFIHGIPYGVPYSDDTTIGSQQLNLLQLLSPEASTDPTLYAAVNSDTTNPIIPTADTSNPLFPTTDTPNPFSPTTDTSQPFLLSAGLSNPTYTFNAPENQDTNGVVPTDTLNVEGSTGTLVAKKWWRNPPALAPEDRPAHDTPNCEGQKSRDRSHQRFLSCCNAAKTVCVYFKRTHELCKLIPKWRGPAHPIQCCSNIPVDGGSGDECQNANNPFNVNIPSISTPFGGTPDIKFKVNIPDVEIPGEVTPGEAPVEMPVGPVPRL